MKRAGQPSNKFFHYGYSEILHYHLIHPLLETKAAIPNALPLSLQSGAKPGEIEVVDYFRLEWMTCFIFYTCIPKGSLREDPIEVKELEGSAES